MTTHKKIKTTKRSSKKASKKTKKASKKNRATKTKDEICFAIMPFGGWFDDYYVEVYRPAIEAAGMKAHRADDLYRPSTIINDIWAYTQKAKLVLADLSGKNPNVFYELGLAHALAKPAILITESIADVPFDLRSLRVLEYDKNDPDWGKTLSHKITSAIKEVLTAPLQAVLPTFLEAKPKKERVKLSEREKDIIELRQEIESLRSSVRTGPVTEPTSIGPSEARQKIRNYIALGLPDSLIVERLERLGPPESWILNTAQEIRDEKQKAMNAVLEAGLASAKQTKPKSRTPRGSTKKR